MLSNVTGTPYGTVLPFWLVPQLSKNKPYDEPLAMRHFSKRTRLEFVARTTPQLVVKGDVAPTTYPPSKFMPEISTSVELLIVSTASELVLILSVTLPGVANILNDLAGLEIVNPLAWKTANAGGVGGTKKRDLPAAIAALIAA